MWGRMFKMNIYNLVIKPILNSSWPWCFNFKSSPMQCWMTYLDAVNAAISGVRAHLGCVALFPGSCKSLQMQCAGEPCFTWDTSAWVWRCHTGISILLLCLLPVQPFYFSFKMTSPIPNSLILSYLHICVCIYVHIHVCICVYRCIER